MTLYHLQLSNFLAALKDAMAHMYILYFMSQAKVSSDVKAKAGLSPWTMELRRRRR